MPAPFLVLALLAAAPLSPQYDSVAVDCNQCMPCNTPPCYSPSPPSARARARVRRAHATAPRAEDDDAYPYSGNSPGASYNGMSLCWQQRLALWLSELIAAFYIGEVVVRAI